MKRLLLAVAVLVATGTMAFAQGSVEKALLDLEQQWVKAQLAGNAQALEPILAADFVSLQSDGTIQAKAVYVANTTKTKWQASAVSDLKVQLHGDSAVVTGIWTGKGTDPAGKAFDSRERFADTWVKMPDGKWQCVASAGITIK